MVVENEFNDIKVVCKITSERCIRQKSRLTISHKTKGWTKVEPFLVMGCSAHGRRFTRDCVKDLPLPFRRLCCVVPFLSSSSFKTFYIHPTYEQQMLLAEE